MDKSRLITKPFNVFATLAEAFKPDTDWNPINFITIRGGIVTGDLFRKQRIAKGDQVRVKAAGDLLYLTDCTTEEGPTHVITECRGLLFGRGEQVECRSLVDDSIIVVNL